MNAFVGQLGIFHYNVLSQRSSDRDNAMVNCTLDYDHWLKKNREGHGEGT